jgi:protein-L-isoaspartate(D-aspartate) O-methyltransferase
MDFVSARQNMVESQVRVNDVTDMAIQKAMRHIERERLCAPSQAFAAYGEFETEIAPGRFLMKPRDLSKLLQNIKPKPGETALAIGAPYAAAVLSHIGLTVTALESDARTVSVISPYLSELGVKTLSGDFIEPAGAPAGTYDVIITEGAVVSVPEAWIRALKVGGRLAVVVRSGPVGKAQIITRVEGDVAVREAFDSMPGFLPGFGPKAAFVF